MNSNSSKKEPISGWRKRLHEIVYEADTQWGKQFDIFLLVFIILSVLAVMFESVRPINEKWGRELLIAEWFFTIVFTIEYIMRILAVKKPIKYIFSFYGIVDLLSIIPSYAGIFITGSQQFLTLRSLRLLRVFRILKLVRYLKAARNLRNALNASKQKIIVFLFSILMIVIVMGTLMYWIESEEAGFTSIPRSIYWAIVTLTTVGYGDIAPQTAVGQMFASMIMIIGYAIIAVPTGIVTSEIISSKSSPKIPTNTQACMSCSREGHDDDAEFCKFCGEKL